MHAFPDPTWLIEAVIVGIPNLQIECGGGSYSWLLLGLAAAAVLAAIPFIGIFLLGRYWPSPQPSVSPGLPACWLIPQLVCRRLDVHYLPATESI